MPDGLTPDKKDGLKQIMGQYSGKASLSDLVSEDPPEDIKRFKRYFSLTDSLIQSLKEMQLMREGKLSKKTWDELKTELDSSNSLEQEKYGEDLEED